MKYCSRCGKPADDAARFCETCGHEFADAITGAGGLVGSKQDESEAMESFQQLGDDTSSPAAVHLDPKISGLIAAAIVVIVVSILGMGVAPALFKPLVKPLVCPSGSREMIVVSSTSTVRGGSHTLFEIYCVDSLGAPRYVSDGKFLLGVLGAALTLAVFAFVSVFVVLWLIKSVMTNKKNFGNLVLLSLSAVALFVGACAKGTISSEDFQHRFEGYLWKKGGQMAFRQDVEKILGTKAAGIRFLQFRGTRADLVLGPENPGRYYYYDLGHLVKAGRGSMRRNVSPCLMNLSRLDPSWVPKAVARARRDAPGITISSVSVLGRSSSGASRCDSWTFLVEGRGADSRGWHRTYDQGDL